MTRLFWILAVLFFVAPQFLRADCHFQRLKLEKRDEQSSLAKLKDNLQIVLDGGDSDHNVHEGPAWIEVNGKKKCTIEGGIFSEVYYAPDKNLLMIEEYSGSCGDHRIVDPKTCKQKGATASYCGAAKLDGDKLVNEPPCELLSDGKVGTCSTGKIFLISPKSCELSWDKKASLALTKEKVGIELPLENKAFKVTGIGTPQAKIEKE